MGTLMHGCSISFAWIFIASQEKTWKSSPQCLYIYVCFLVMRHKASQKLPISLKMSEEISGSIFRMWNVINCREEDRSTRNRKTTFESIGISTSTLNIVIQELEIDMRWLHYIWPPFSNAYAIQKYLCKLNFQKLWGDFLFSKLFL